MKRVFLLVAIATLWTSGCEKKVEEPGGNTASIDTPTPVIEPEVKVAEEIIPLEYKKAAENEITAENAEAKADELAKEIEEDNE